MNFAALLGRNSGRATPSLRRFPKAHHSDQGNPAERHLSPARSCSDKPSQLCLPGAEWHASDHPLALQSAAIGAGHVGVHRGLINEDEMRGIKQPLPAYPTSAGAGHVCPFLFAGMQDFF